MKYHKHLLKTTLAASAIAILASCDPQPSDVKSTVEQQEETTQVAETQKDTLAPRKAKFFFQSLPSPLHIAHIFKRAGVKYEPGLTLSPDKASQYVSTSSQAMNLGVYSADLAYYTINDQTQETISSLKAAKKLAEGLEIVEVYEAQNLVDRFESNIGNRDSLLGLLSDLTIESDLLLKQGERYDIVFLSFAGAWVESMYLASEIASKSESKDIIKRIAAQKASLDNLIGLLSEYKGRKEFDNLIEKLSGLSANLATVSQDLSTSTENGTNAAMKSFAAFKTQLMSVRKEITSGV